MKNDRSGPTESRRSLLRMGSNYLRLFVNAAIGLVLVRLLLASVGGDAWGLISLLGSTAGIVVLLEELVNQLLLREMGRALHEDSPERFSEVFNAAILISLVAAGLAVLLFAAAWAALPLLRLETPEFLWAGRWLIVIHGAGSCLGIVLAPFLRMLLLHEWMTVFNTLLVVQRLAHLAGALVVYRLAASLEPAAGAVLYAAIAWALIVALRLFTAIVLVRKDRRLRPIAQRMRSSEARRLVRENGWNVAALVGFNLHTRADAILMNLFFGIGLNRIFGLANVLASYVRMLSTGVSDGLEAVVTRHSTRGRPEQSTELLLRSTWLQASVCLPLATVLLMAGERLVDIWVGDRLQNPRDEVTLVALLMSVLVIGTTARALTDSWVRTLYGAGLTPRYAPFVLAAAIANPVLVVLVLGIFPIATPASYLVPAAVFSLLQLVVHLGFLSRLVCRAFEIRPGTLLRQILFPAAATLISAPVLGFALKAREPSGLLELLPALLPFAAVYAALSLASYRLSRSL